MRRSDRILFDGDSPTIDKAIVVRLLFIDFDWWSRYRLDFFGKKDKWGKCGRIGYSGPTGRTGPSPDPSDPTAYCTHTSLAQLLASSSLLVEVILASSIGLVTN